MFYCQKIDNCRIYGTKFSNPDASSSQMVAFKSDPRVTTFLLITDDADFKTSNGLVFYNPPRTTSRLAVK